MERAENNPVFDFASYRRARHVNVRPPMADVARLQPGFS
jgi:hypothetical protein